MCGPSSRLCQVVPSCAIGCVIQLSHASLSLGMIISLRSSRGRMLVEFNLKFAFVWDWSLASLTARVSLNHPSLYVKIWVVHDFCVCFFFSVGADHQITPIYIWPEWWALGSYPASWQNKQAWQSALIQTERSFVHTQKSLTNREKVILRHSLYRRLFSLIR